MKAHGTIFSLDETWLTVSFTVKDTLLFNTFTLYVTVTDGLRAATSTHLCGQVTNPDMLNLDQSSATSSILTINNDKLNSIRRVATAEPLLELCGDFGGRLGATRSPAVRVYDLRGSSR